MKLLLLVIITLALSVLLGLAVKDDSGYVLINAYGYTAETSLLFLVVLMALLFTALYFTLRFYANIKYVPRGYKLWRSRQNSSKANETLIKGLIELSEGNWSDAEKNVVKYANQQPASLLNYLAAARAAQEQGAYERRDTYLRSAHQSTPSADIAVGLTQAELQLDQNQLEQALATLRRLQQLAPKHKRVLKNLAKLYRDLGDWNHLVELIPILRKRKVFSPERISEMEEQAFMRLLDMAVTDERLSLQDVWYRIPQPLQEKEAILCQYVNFLLETGNSNVAEPLLRNALKKNWSESLVRLYGIVDAPEPKRQLQTAESWLSSHENNATVLLTLGRLSLRNRLWGKARDYFEASIGAGSLAEAYHELGHLLEKLGEMDKAIKCYRKGLEYSPGCHYGIAQNLSAHEVEHKPRLSPPGN
ncbi:MAG: heme biosynthesis protein HemY [Gammaproteobacteria bacterium]|nr:heme biosynthesis protein HemY [Gammaproteobacteria bacterium]MDH5799563.1 heme biosynthesis protein HemY [Gammaproteobacteria bacterium]